MLTLYYDYDHCYYLHPRKDRGLRGFHSPLLRVRFFKKIQDWILKSERILKRILRFFTKPINARSFGSWRVKGTEESTSKVDSSVPLRHHNPKDLALICLVKKRKIRKETHPKIYFFPHGPIQGKKENVFSGHRFYGAERATTSIEL